MHDFSLPGPSATPDASQRFIEKLLESIPVPPTIAPTQAAPIPAQPAPTQPAPVPIQPTPAAAPAAGVPSWIPQ